MKRLSRKKHGIYILAMVMLVCSFVAGCSNGSNQSGSSSKSQNESGETVKILLGKESLCLAPIHIAVANGYLDDEFKAVGQDYELIDAEVNQATELLTAGKINAAYGLTGTLMQPISNGLDISFTTGLHTGCTKYYVKNDSGIKSLEDLKGKKIGVPALSDSSVINLKRKLADIGLTVNGAKADIEFVAYAMTDLPAALDNGGVDAIGIHDPVATTAEEEYGFTKILDVGEDEKFKDEYCCQAYVSRDLVKNNPEGAAAYTRAMQKAAAFIEAAPQDAAKIQIDEGYMTGEAEENGKILEGFSYVPSVTLGKETFAKSFKELQAFGDIDASLDAEEFEEKTYATLDNVPDSMTYNKNTKEFTESAQ